MKKMLLFVNVGLALLAFCQAMSNDQADEYVGNLLSGPFNEELKHLFPMKIPGFIIHLNREQKVQYYIDMLHGRVLGANDAAKPTCKVDKLHLKSNQHFLSCNTNVESIELQYQVYYRRLVEEGSSSSSYSVDETFVGLNGGELLGEEILKAKADDTKVTIKIRVNEDTGAGVVTDVDTLLTGSLGMESKQQDVFGDVGEELPKEVEKRMKRDIDKELKKIFKKLFKEIFGKIVADNPMKS